MHSTLVKRRTTNLARLDALLEILGPDWHAALSGDLANKTPLRFLAAGYADPHTVKRLGRARLVRFFRRHSPGAWGELEVDAILAAANATLVLWDEELEFADLAEDIAVEARLALALTEEIKEVDERIAVLVAQRDPNGILASVPGVGPVTGAVILVRLGDPDRFASLAARGAFHERQPGPPLRPHTGGEVPPPHGRGRQASQLGSMPHRHDPAHPRCRLLEVPDALPAARRRRPNRGPQRSKDDRRRSLHRARTRTTSTVNNPAGNRDGPAKQGVTKCSINRPVHHPR
jgi:hypothetical protein